MNTQLGEHGLAFDRASVRSFTVEGRMNVESSHISMEQVSEYLGREIPRWAALGLDPGKVYRVYRPAEELEKAAATFNGIPVLTEHVPVNAENPRQDLVVGATGTDAVFNAPYLDNSLVIWAQEGIDLIESGEQKELSCAYRYVAVVEAGTFKGQPYDIRMTDLKANHVALVARGRAGPTVVVGDSINQEIETMKKHPSRMSLLARGALLALVPSMALDSALAGVTASNWKQRRPDIEKNLKTQLAQDADVGHLVKLLDGLNSESESPAAADPVDGQAPEPTKPTPGEENEQLDATDADPCAEVLDMLRDKLSPEDLAAVEAKLRGMGAAPAGASDDNDPAGPPATPGTPPNPATSEKEDMNVTQTAMDAAIAKAQANGLRIAREIADAERTVRPLVGDIVAQDSADGVYKAALELRGVSTEGVHPSAFKSLFDAELRVAGAKAAQPVRGATIAMDSQTKAAERFPNMARIKRIG